MEDTAPEAEKYNKLRDLIPYWQAKAKVDLIQTAQSFLTSGYERTITRRQAVQWLFARCKEVATTAKTPQFATTLLDLYASRMPRINQQAHLVASAGCLSLAIKVCESFSLSLDAIAQLPGLRMTNEEVGKAEQEVMLVTGWNVDVLTAAEVIDMVKMAGVELPNREAIDVFQANCYQCPAVRFSPLIIAFSPLVVLHDEFITKLCFESGFFSESEVNELMSEVTLEDSLLGINMSKG